MSLSRPKKTTVTDAVKKKRKKVKDPAFNPRQAGTGHGEGALNILTAASKTVTDKDGKEIPKKVAHLFASPVKNLLDGESKKALKEKNKTIPMHTAAKPIEFFHDGVPKVLQTPMGTKLHYRGGAKDLMYSYVNCSPLTELTNPRVSKEFFETKAGTALVPNLDKIKKQSVLLTKELLAKSKRKIRESNGKRVVSQAAVMKAADADIKDASATKIAKAAGVAPEVSKHFAHAIGYQFLAEVSQKPINLSITTVHSNGAYLANLEFALKILVEKSDGVLVTTEVECFENAELGKVTHIQKQTKVTLEVLNGFKLQMTFDGQQLFQTDKTAKNAMCNLAVILIKQYIKDKRPAVKSPQKSAADFASSPNIFFSRKENVAAMRAEADKENIIKKVGMVGKSKRRKLNFDDAVVKAQSTPAVATAPAPTPLHKNKIPA